MILKYRYAKQLCYKNCLKIRSELKHSVHKYAFNINSRRKRSSNSLYFVMRKVDPDKILGFHGHRLLKNYVAEQISLHFPSFPSLFSLFPLPLPPPLPLLTSFRPRLEGLWERRLAVNMKLYLVYFELKKSAFDESNFSASINQ